MTQPAEPSPTPNRRRSAPAIVLTSHARNDLGGLPIAWGAGDARARGPVVGSLNNPGGRNAVGTHAGAYSLYRALAVAARQLDAGHRPDLTDTQPAMPIGPFAQWGDAQRIVSLDPWGHLTGQSFAPEIAAGWDIRPTIAVTRAHIDMPEIRQALRDGRLRARRG